MNQSDIVGPSSVLVPGSQQLLLKLSVLIAIAGLITLVVALLLRYRSRRKGRDRKRPVVTTAAAVTVVVALVLGWWNRPPPFFVPEFPALPRLFPEEGFFYRPVSDLPVSGRSDEMIGALGGLPLGVGVGSQVTNGQTRGGPFNLVDSDTPRERFSFRYPTRNQEVEFPIADPPYIQSMPLYGNDEHYIAIDTDAAKMWELWAIRDWFGSWRAGSGAVWDLNSLEYPEGGTTASAMPMQPLSITYAQVAAGSVDHAIGAGSPIISPEHVWPARGSDGPSKDPDAPPMGAWLRLKADTDLSQFGPQARVIARAMMEYGLILGDTSGRFGTGGTPDARWDDEDVATLNSLTSDDFEVIDASGLMVDAGSMAAVGPG